jgi:hypothetical protein
MRAILASLASSAIALTAMAAPLASHPNLSPDPASHPLLKPVLLKPYHSAPNRVTSKEKQEIEDAVRMQIRAYVARDAGKAFAKLAPSTQRFFGEPDRFFRALAEAVPVILNTRRFAFLGAARSGQVIVEQVLMTDGGGREWLAEFQLERVEDEGWRIKGCVIESAPGQQA